MAGKQVIPREEMVEKIHAAVDARRDPDLAIVGRTDARALEGLGKALERAKAYREAGADVIFVTGTQSVEEMREVTRSVPGPHKLTWPDRSSTKVPILTAREYQEIGYSVVSYSITLTLLIAKQVLETLEQIKREGTTTGVYDRLASFEEVTRILGLPTFAEMERRYAVTE
jgi:2-methylisocitrate lyase-like PEP mutase family enzyme